MDWLMCLRGAVDYMEEHLLEPVTPGEIGRAVHISPFYLQKGFQIITGYSLGEYMRCRRLYLAAMDLLAGEGRVIDIAYKYCYQTPESFAKAFSRFHGFPPSQVKQERGRIRMFLPFQITLSIQGGESMNFTVEKMEGFKVIGFEEVIPMDKGYELCPKLWDRLHSLYFSRLWQGGAPQTDVDRAIIENGIGMCAVCADDEGQDGGFAYMVGGRYKGGPVPEGLTVRDIPAADWAKFHSIGPMPEGLQALNTKIFKEWLPINPDYDWAYPLNIEFYTEDMDYEIWLPVAEKEKG